jgi:hypothetical protein
VRRSLQTLLIAALTLCVFSTRAVAQDPPPKIGPFALDVHVTVPRFPSDNKQLADSRGLAQGELPSTGLGLHGSATAYVLTWKAVTFGLGADVTVARAHSAAKLVTRTTMGRAVTEEFSHIAPELSFNFGTGNGWSYLSGGIGPGVWSVVPDGTAGTTADTERLQTINYGGGARWFLNSHVAFSLDVRFYAINPSTPVLGLPGGPRKTLVFMGGGLSLK